jgi:chemotaxis protein methyltransferase CheR
MNNFLFSPGYGAIGEDELALFRDFLLERTGIVIPPEKAYLFETRLSSMMVGAGADSFKDFYDYVVSGEDPNAAQKIIDAMTVNETLWFRDVAPWKVLEQSVLPRLVEEIKTGKRQRARIWCAAASTGQEAYSTAMCVDDYLNRAGEKGVTLADFEILATDISSRVLSIAKMGRYDAITIGRGLSDYYREKYFKQDSSAWDLAPKIRQSVRFSLFNLKNDYGILGTFDVIFCRYVLIYFSNGLKKEVSAKMHGSLAENGVLFTGNYPIFDILADHYDPNHYGNLTYYTKRTVEA